MTANPFQFPLHAHCGNIEDIDLENLFDRFLDFDLVRPTVHLEEKLVSLVLLDGALLSYQGASQCPVCSIVHARASSILITHSLLRITELWFSRS